VRRAPFVPLLISCALIGAAQPAKLPEKPPRLMPLGGQQRTVMVQKDSDTLLDIAFENRVGFEALERLNPELDPWIPVPGSVVELPTRFVLPNAAQKGLVINVPEMRLYDYSVDPVEVFAAAIGDEADPSLIGVYKVGQKRVDPAWRVPASIRAEKPDLPAVVPPGPDNPLGSRWMSIGNTSYGIHGTNVRWSIGRMATHGCVRLYEDQIQRLFERTKSGTRLELVYQPYKWGVQGQDLYLEVHPDLYARYTGPLAEALRTPQELGILEHVDVDRARRVVEEQRGVPVRVGRLPEPPPAPPATSKRTS
jgi:L,D-transpeptidase ErfK/SrfK